VQSRETVVRVNDEKRTKPVGCIRPYRNDVPLFLEDFDLAIHLYIALPLARYTALPLVAAGLLACSAAPPPAESVGSTSSALLGNNALDPTFGQGGQTFVAVQATPNYVAVQADGKIVIAGGSAASGFVLVRLSANGSVDTSFGNGSGTVNTAFPEGTGAAISVAFQKDGKIVAVGGVHNGGVSMFAVARYNTDGSLDSGFGAGGRVTTNVSGLFDQNATVVLVQPDQKILVGGVALVNISRHNQSEAVLVRYTTSGALDPSFGSGGIAASTSVPTLAPTAMGLESDGSVLLTNVPPIVPPPPVSRFDANGNQEAVALNGTLAPIAARGDVTFGPNGTLVLTNSFGRSGGSRLHPAGSIIQVREFSLSGTLLFDTGGFDWGNGLFGSFELPYAVAVEPNGNVVVGGAWQPTLSTEEWAVAEVQPNGRLNPSFGTGGVAQVPFGGSSEIVYALAVQPADGKIIAAGSAAHQTTGIGVARLIP
jgi:uncharacterized delta-60 repeat protein